MELEYPTDIATQRALAVSQLGVDIGTVKDERTRRIMREMMQKLVDTIVTPAKGQLKSIANTKSDSNG